MLKKLHLTNFRKHEDLEVLFSPGIVVIRGANEAGKSTLSESIAYAMFGAKACRQPIDEVVTWGKPVNTLKVGLEFVFDGVDYTVSRSKSGAELRYEGGVVTGQNEVTGFIERLMGAPAKLATSLWFVSQNSIRGALESGANATAQMIEQLADFELVDRIVELIQNNLATGQARPYEERLKQAQDNMENFREEVQPPSQFAVDWLEAAKRELVLWQSALVEMKKESQEFDATVMKPLLDKATNLDTVMSMVKDLEEKVAEGQSRVDSFVVVGFNPEELRKVEKLQAEAEALWRSQNEIAAGHAAFKKLPDPSNCLWDGDRASYDAFVEDMKVRRNDNAKRLYEITSDLKVEKASIISQQSCGLCGKDLREVPEVVTKNEAASRRIEQLEEEQKQLKLLSQEIEAEVAAVAAIDKMVVTYAAFISKYEATGWIEVKDVSVPAQVVWVGPTPSGDSFADYSEDIRNLKAAEQAHNKGKAQLEMLEQQLVESKTKLQTLQEQTLQFHAENPNLLERVEEVSSEALRLTNAYVQQEGEISKLQAEIKETADAVATQTRLYNLFQKTKEAAEQALRKAEKDLEELTQNNLLLKKVRASRPAIVDRLWTVVLSAVSFYFGSMRGTAGVSVVRSEGGFLVDGKPIEGLSGSTLDILGLAIRLALLKTFLPSCSFLLLDEPGAACDDNRESSLIGTIATSHFDQILLVTHSDVADAYANQLVII